ncbi:hypothetical protein SEA_PHABULOSO_46 [Gordonia phage Phabuloso]|nr:hypothetical protein SEA_PHABULOSO_46 [Gordonia phage Phabuloso]
MPDFWIGDRVADPALISPELRALFADAPEVPEWNDRRHEWTAEIGSRDA